MPKNRTSNSRRTRSSFGHNRRTYQIRLFDKDQKPKYLGKHERARLLESLGREPDLRVRTLIQVLIHSGIRPIEATRLCRHHVDPEIGQIIVRNAKKNPDADPRLIALPYPVIDCLLELPTDPKCDHKFWPWSRITVWRHVKHQFKRAGIAGPHATVRGLRHTFAVHALACGVDLVSVSQCMGHESLETTAVYAKATGMEARQIAQRMWTKAERAPRYRSPIVRPGAADPEQYQKQAASNRCAAAVPTKTESALRLYDKLTALTDAGASLFLKDSDGNIQELILLS